MIDLFSHYLQVAFHCNIPVVAMLGTSTYHPPSLKIVDP